MMRPFLFEAYEPGGTFEPGLPCAYCGKGTMPGQNRMVRVFQGGNEFAREESIYFAPDDDISEDMGFYPVHKDCASILRRRRVYIGHDLS